MLALLLILALFALFFGVVSSKAFLLVALVLVILAVASNRTSL